MCLFLFSWFCSACVLSASCGKVCFHQLFLALLFSVALVSVAVLRFHPLGEDSSLPSMGSGYEVFADRFIPGMSFHFGTPWTWLWAKAVFGAPPILEPILVVGYRILTHGHKSGFGWFPIFPRFLGISESQMQLAVKSEVFKLLLAPWGWKDGAGLRNISL